MPTVLQPWVEDLTMMQQSVLLTAVRGPDALPKYHPSKFLLRWYRRCLLLSAMDQRVLEDPFEPNGGSFTGPSVLVKESFEKYPLYKAAGSLRDESSWAVSHNEGGGWRSTWWSAMNDWVTSYIRSLDEVPHHYQLHFMHAVEIMGYKRPDIFWRDVYFRLAKDMHLTPETEESLDHRLGDSREQWLDHADEATQD